MIIVDKIYRDYVYVECPYCDAVESYPIDEQRHHLQTFSIVEWRDTDEEEISVTNCHSCKKDFLLKWNYKQIKETEL